MNLFKFLALAVFFFLISVNIYGKEKTESLSSSAKKDLRAYPGCLVLRPKTAHGLVEFFMPGFEKMNELKANN